MTRFLTGTALGAVATWLAWVPLCQYWLPHANGVHWFLDQAYARKDQALATTTAPRVVLVGASSVAYGFRANVMARELDRPVINYAGTAALDIDFLLWRLVPNLHAGDTVVLPLEHAYYGESSRRSALCLRAMSAIDPQTGGQLVPWLGSRVAARTDPAWLLASAPVPGAVRREINEEVSPLGDYVNNQPAAPGTAFAKNKIERLAKALQAPPSTPGASPLWEHLAEPIARLQTNGVKVLAAQANYFADPAYDTPIWQEFFGEIAQSWDRMNVPMVGKPSDGFFPEEKMWDSRSHVVESASEDRAIHFAAQLLPLLPSPQD